MLYTLSIVGRRSRSSCIVYLLHELYVCYRDYDQALERPPGASRNYKIAHRPEDRIRRAIDATFRQEKRQDEAVTCRASSHGVHLSVVVVDREVQKSIAIVCILCVLRSARNSKHESD